MLLGKSTNTLDSKFRLFIPVKWRVDLTDHVILLYGFNTSENERYLQLMSFDRFQEFSRAVDQLHPTDMSFIRAQRFIFPNAEDLNPDKQGRILIPQDLVKYADLNGEVLLIGMSNHIEIWNPEKYKASCAGYGYDQFRIDMQSLADRTSGNSSN